jgi:LysR family transcriptional activator of mexEF-oprN operon
MPTRNSDKFELLVTFQALLEHGSVVSAAKARGMSQSATSKHLIKLRNWFNDDLFVRTAGKMQPTERALQIAQSSNTIIKSIDALSEIQHFDPSQLSGEFTIATTDEVGDRLLPKLVKELEQEAPKLSLRLLPLEQDYSEKKLEHGQVDLVITVNWHAPDLLMQKKLFSDEFVCLMSVKNPLAQQKLDLENYANASHALVAPLGILRGYPDEYLAQNGMRRFIKVAVPMFSQINYTLIRDDLIVTVPARVAAQAQKDPNLISKPIPFKMPRIDYYMFWHSRYNNAQSNSWLRKLVEQALSD